MSKWDILTERGLLITIMEVTSPKPPPWGLVSEKMGPGFTAESCRYVSSHLNHANFIIKTMISVSITPLGLILTFDADSTSPGSSDH